jgi:TRAP-type mannitol/chloroaromatic compound transport system substrate-binding protein
VIDCAEWVGGVEDLRLGLPGVFKYHYTPGMHENNSIGEFGLHNDVWKSFNPQQQQAVQSAINDAFITWLTRWQKQNADAIEEMIKKHGVQIRRTPPDILIASLKAWDEVAAEHSAKNPTFKKVYESQREYAARSCRPSATCSRRTRSRPTTTGRRKGSGAPARLPRRASKSYK